MLDFGQMHQFRSIPEKTWHWVQQEAQKRIDSEQCDVIELDHLQSIVGGDVPFGMITPVKVDTGIEFG